MTKNIKKTLIVSVMTLGAVFTSFDAYGDSDQYHFENIKLQPEPKVDYSKITDVKEKKALFIKNSLIGINNANKEICAEEAEIKTLQQKVSDNNSLSSSETEQLNKLADFYDVDENLSTQEKLQELRIKIGTAPQSFVLAQAILESGWGTSRFARDYNNYFGLHCYNDGCGAKAQKADVYMEIFKTPGDSILGYYKRLNTGSAFKEFRQTRQKTNNLDSLLNTLGNYSELGLEEYKSRLMDVINHNDLTQYDKPVCS